MKEPGQVAYEAWARGTGWKWHKCDDTERRAWAAAEAAAAAKALEPFELLMRHYEQGERVELYVGEGGGIYAESPSAYGFGDDVTRAAKSLCRALGLLPKPGNPDSEVG